MSKRTNYTPWLQADADGRISWTLDDAHKLVAGWKPIEDDDKQLSPKLTATSNRAKAEQRNLIADFSKDNTPCQVIQDKADPELEASADVKHRPTPFVDADCYVRWAKSKGYEVPAALHQALNAKPPEIEGRLNDGGGKDGVGMNITLTIGGRVAIPVRALPFITGQEMSPDMVAAVLAHDDLFFRTIRGEPIPLTAYHLVDGKPHPMPPKAWNNVCGGMHTLSSKLVASAWAAASDITSPVQHMETARGDADMDQAAWEALPKPIRNQLLLGSTTEIDPKAHIRDAAHVLTRDKWLRDSVELLPAGVFVWRDEFEPAFQHAYANVLIEDERPGDRELDFSPWMVEETLQVVMEGFASPLRVDGRVGWGANEVVQVLLEREAADIAAWYDTTMQAAMWFRRANIKPVEAAMLLWRLNPLERDWQGDAPDPERTYVDGDETSPKHYRALRRAFEDVAETDPKPRTLLDWRDVARREGLRYHQWIDQYVVAARIEESPTDSGSGDGMPKVDGGDTDKSTTEALAVAQGVPSAEILEHFSPHLKGQDWDNCLRHWKTYPYLKPPVFVPYGTRKGKTLNLWNPAQFGWMLANRKRKDGTKPNLRAIHTIIEQHFDKWFDEWCEISGWNSV